MDRVKAYSWLLTVIMGLATTTALKNFFELVVVLPQAQHSPIAPAAIRLAILLLLALRWTLGTLWYFDRAYIAKNPQVLGYGFCYELLASFMHFMIFVPLALAVTVPIGHETVLSTWLNDILLPVGKKISTFIWILGLLLLFDSVLALPAVLQLIVRAESIRWVHIFWAGLNILTLITWCLIFLIFEFIAKPLDNPECVFLYFILGASIIDIWGTIIETSSLSKRLSP